MITNKNFIKELKLKNPEALDFVLDTFGDLIYKISYVHLKSITLSEQCIHNVLITIEDSIDIYDYPDDKFKNWIASISTHCSLELLNQSQEDLLNSEGGISLWKNLI